MPNFSPAADTYLDRLATALRDVRDPVRGEIWSGIAEELDGLDESDARNRNLAGLCSRSRRANSLTPAAC